VSEMKYLLIIFALLCSPAMADHYYWTKHTTAVEPSQTLRRDRMLVYTGVSDSWIIDWNNRLCDLWMAPDKASDVIGYFQVSVGVRPLKGSKAVCDIIEPTLSDYTTATRMRWAFKRAATNKVGVSNVLTYLGHAWFPMRTTVPYKSATRNSWLYGLHAWEGLHTRVPAGGYFRPTTLDISTHAECAYKVGGFKLKFEKGHATHNPGLSEISIGEVSTLRWSDEGIQGGTRWYNANITPIPGRVVTAIVAVQRKGDCNCDGKVNGEDIKAFLLAMNNPPLYEELYYGIPPEFNCDVNWDGVVNGMDVGPFISAVLNNGVAGDYWDSIDYD
jgi:hypothetical protein